MRLQYKIFILPCLLLAGVVLSDDVQQGLRERPERTVLDDLTAVEQARATAQSRSEYGLELRPRITDDDVGAALRIYLPSRWNKDKLREQLELVAEEELLRVTALEWQELIEVYRQFCDYRMLNKQLELYQKQLSRLEPYLEKADEEVKLNQLAVSERAKLYSFYLDLVNSHEKIKADLLQAKAELYHYMGVEADLDAMAPSAIISMPPKMEFETLVGKALDSRPDYRAFDVQAQAISAAESIAQDGDGFRLKYIQPDYQVNYDNGENTYGLSASFILPWGTRNPDVALYQRQRELSLTAKDIHRQLIRDRLQVLIKTAEDYYAQAAVRSDRIKPLLQQLSDDMATMETGRLEELRDLLLVQERILDVSLQTTRAIRRKERIAVDLAEELGSLTP